MRPATKEEIKNLEPKEIIVIEQQYCKPAVAPFTKEHKFKLYYKLDRVMKG